MLASNQKTQNEQVVSEAQVNKEPKMAKIIERKCIECKFALKQEDCFIFGMKISDLEKGVLVNRLKGFIPVDTSTCDRFIHYREPPSHKKVK